MRIRFCLLALLLAAAPAAAQNGAADPPPAPRRAPAVFTPPPVELPGDSARALVAAGHSALLVARGGSRYSIGRYAGIGTLAGAAVGLGWGLAHEDEDAFGLNPVLPAAIGAGIGFFAGFVVDVVRGR
ncbi:MAG TPA: hypothetical protein VF584_06355 [Longimicrobium sp.]|jgi:hypothetical protein